MSGFSWEQDMDMHRAWITGLAGLLGLAVACAPALARPRPGCQVFQAELKKALPDLGLDFVRPLVVTRGETTTDDLFDLLAKAGVDGSLRCRDDRLMRFDLRVTMPATDQALDRFAKIQAAAVRVAFQWPEPRIATTLKRLENEASDYLRASRERGDIYLAGKTEFHEDGTDMGMIHTPVDRGFVIVGE
jgi:hypothetical protein